MQIKRMQKEFVKILKFFGDCHDLYVQSNTLLLGDVFENFPNMCHFELEPAHFLSPPGLAWQATLKLIKVKLYLLADYIDMLLIVERSVRGRICHSIY